MCTQLLLTVMALSSYSMLQADGASTERRQANLPMDCSALVLEANVTTTTCPNLNAFRTVVDLVGSPDNPEWNTIANRAWLRDTLDDFCTSDCFNYTLAYFSQNCSWTDQFAMNTMALYRDYYCATSNMSGDYCLVEVTEYLADTVFLDLVLQCNTAVDDFCSPLCLGVVEGFQTELGCCAVNLFNSTVFTQFPFDLVFENCGISLDTDDMCSTGGTPPTTVISLLLLIVATLLSLFSLN